MKYYRVAEINRNQKKDTSMHIPLHIDDQLGQYINDIDKLMELIDYADEAEKIERLEEHLDDHLFYQSDGHLGEGVYCRGVCACESLEELETYFNDRGGYPESAGCGIFEIEGEYLDTLLDCELVEVKSFTLLREL